MRKIVVAPTMRTHRRAGEDRRMAIDTFAAAGRHQDRRRRLALLPAHAGIPTAPTSPGASAPGSAPAPGPAPPGPAPPRPAPPGPKGSEMNRHRRAGRGAQLGALLALALASPASAATHDADASYLAAGPGGLSVAIGVHAGRVQVYACDGRARKAFFAGPARRRLRLRSAVGDRLTMRLGARSARATLALEDAEPVTLSAHRARAAIFAVSIGRDGAVTGTAPGGGVLGAHLSGNDLAGALAFPGAEPGAFDDPTFAPALFLDGRPLSYPATQVAGSLHGEWRWIVTPSRILGATRKRSSFDIKPDPSTPPRTGIGFIDNNIGF
jgi:hypothetical protein